MVGEVLVRLCSSGGWTYAALWRIDCGDPRLLVLEDSFHEEHSGEIFAKMISQVHAIEQRIIGEVAISGKYRWINFDSTSSINSATFQTNFGWRDQILAGIQTIALIPLPSFSVIQFGSSHKIYESSDFISRAQSLLQQLPVKQHAYIHKDLNFCHPQPTFPSVISSLDSSRFKHNASSQYHDNLFYGTPCFIGTSSSYQVINQESALTQEQTSLPQSNTELHPSFKCVSRAKEIDTFSYTDNHLYSQMAIPGVLNMTPMARSSDLDAFHLFGENSMLSFRDGGSKAMFNRNHDTSFYPNEELTNDHALEKIINNPIHSVDRGGDWIQSTSDVHNQFTSDQNGLFDGMDIDPSPMNLRHQCWNDTVLPIVTASCADLTTGVSDCRSEFTMGSVSGSGKEFFTDSSSLEQLLDAVVAGDANLSTSYNSVASQTSGNHMSTITEISSVQMASVPFISPSLSVSKMMMMPGSSKEAQALWIDDSCSVNTDNSAHNKHEESTKVVRKRAKPGESTRPKPKDRQQIQDRVKELREIVPNGAKCSIDALLDRTIKHMLFLQSVTKYADKVKQVDEPELVGEANGVVLKDNTNGGVGGATWAYEVAGQTMVCPILVEDVHPSGQMIVEMLCEERGFFLEIADVVRGFGLTILKGVMEIRERKLWSKFLVEANRDVTRMDIFLSLVRLLHQASSFPAVDRHSNPTGVSSLTSYQQQYPALIPIGLDDRLL